MIHFKWLLRTVRYAVFVTFQVVICLEQLLEKLRIRFLIWVRWSLFHCIVIDFVHAATVWRSGYCT